MKHRDNSLTALGVRRPILISVVNLLIVLMGLAALYGVDVRELPNVDRPIVMVRADYIGASPETMDSEVTSIIEAAVARVSGVLSMVSSSEENNMRIRVEFATDVDLNQAANDVREAVSRAQRSLPDDVGQVLVIKSDVDAQSVIQLSAVSDTLPKHQLARHIEKDVVPELLSVKGVADVEINGDQPLQIKVQLHPSKIAAYRLSVSEIIDTLKQARFDVPAGSLQSDSKELIVRAYATVIKPEEIAALNIRQNLKIGDVAEVYATYDLGESYALLNGRQVISLGIVRKSGANTVDISTQIQAKVAALNARLPELNIVTTSDDADYIIGALNEVLLTLVFAIIIVLIVIAVFLGQWRATLIPAVTMPISLIGTIAAIWLFGFSINLLTLLAMLLAAGLIVDDAIVVLENIQRLRSQGKEKLAAAVLGTRQVFFAVMATTITLVSVFLPMAFLPGQTGRLFREFGLVLSIAVIISSFVAITLCPMMASRLPHLSQSNVFFAKIRHVLDGIGAKLSNVYFALLRYVLRYRAASLLLSLMIAVMGYYSFTQLERELLPTEDRGSIRVFLTGPDGASLQYSDKQARLVEAILQPYQQRGLITDIYTIVGRWDKNRAYIEATLLDWDERTMSQQQLASEINAKLKNIAGAQVRLLQGNSLNVRGGGSGIALALLGNDYNDIIQSADQFSELLTQNISSINDVRIQFDTSQAQLSFNIDRKRAADLKVPMQRIADTLKVMVDQYDVIDLSIDDQSVSLTLGPAPGTTDNVNDLLNILITNSDDQLVPLSSMVSLQESGVAAELDRHAQRRAIELDIGTPPGVPLGQIMQQIQEIANESLPSDMSIRFLGEAADLKAANYEVMLTFILALVVVFLVLAAQFESIGSALIVIFTVPYGLAAAVFALHLSGITLNLYSQIGLVMLIGLMTKNAILLVEFMDQLRDQGVQVMDAILQGVKIRLRPVMMTAISTVLGALPLLLSSGPGAEARMAIGWVIFAGVGISTLFTLFLAPLGYSLVAPWIKPRSHLGEELAKQLNQNT